MLNEFIYSYFPTFLLVFTRMSAFFVTAPVFSNKGVPARLKIGLAFLVSVITFSSVGLSEEVALDRFFYAMLAKEAIIGLTLGFVATLMLTAVQIAGAFIDMQMGLGIASVFDPQTGIQNPLTGHLKYLIAILLFLSFNGHHLLIDGIVTSYKWVPPHQIWLPALQTGELAMFMVNAFQHMFVIALKIAAPVVGALFLVDVALGIVSRTVPQMNVFVVGLPLKILVGLLLILLLMPGLVFIYKSLFNDMFESMATFLRLIRSEP